MRTDDAQAQFLGLCLHPTRARMSGEPSVSA